MGEIFHGQTKGYMFASDQLHDLNIARKNIEDNRYVLHFTYLSKTCPISITLSIYINMSVTFIAFIAFFINLTGGKI